jgi:hypothetical protein
MTSKTKPKTKPKRAMNNHEATAYGDARVLPKGVRISPKRAPAWWPARFVRLGVYPLSAKELSKPGAYASESKRIREVVMSAQSQARTEERERLERVEAAKPRCTLCTQKLDNEGRCAPCEEMKAMPYKLGVGGVYEIKGYKPNTAGENGKPGKVVAVDAKVAARCRYLGDMRSINGACCVLFKDDKTGLVYAQPAAKERP